MFSSRTPHVQVVPPGMLACHWHAVHYFASALATTLSNVQQLGFGLRPSIRRVVVAVYQVTKAPVGGIA